jgi:hypothetical protein
MFSLFVFVLTTLGSLFRTRAALQLEILALRHQINVLRRSQRVRVRLNALDRFLWARLLQLWSGWRSALIIVKPETVIAWHRRGFRLYWTWKSRQSRPGRPSVSREVRDLIRKMSLANPLWGAPRVHGELLKLGIELSHATVAKYKHNGHLIPSANVNAVDRLDAPTTVQEPATPAQPTPRCRPRNSLQVAERIGGPGRDRTDDLMTASKPPAFHPFYSFFSLP